MRPLGYIGRTEDGRFSKQSYKRRTLCVERVEQERFGTHQNSRLRRTEEGLIKFGETVYMDTLGHGDKQRESN